jgi:hypothetical protein
MDLLASSGSSVPAAVAGKAIRAWAGRRRFGGVDDSQLAASMGTVGSGGRIQRYHRHGSAPMGVVGERAQGFWSGARGIWYNTQPWVWKTMVPLKITENVIIKVS